MKAKNPYLTDTGTAISFSGGRTSAYMLHRILDAHDGDLPDGVHITFANTGKEMPQTLDFVKECSDRWGVPIVWLERYAEEIPEEEREGRKKFRYTNKVVTYETAARNGEPFVQLCLVRRYLPNPVARFCTVEMKIRAITDYMKAQGHGFPYTGMIGIRADEVRRAAKMHNTVESGQERMCPLYIDGVTKGDVSRFWNNAPFDLQLPNNNGTTDWGNCDLCYLKGMNKKITIMRERPDLGDWWIELEDSMKAELGRGAFFRADQPSYRELRRIALDTEDMFAGQDESIPCFCGD